MCWEDKLFPPKVKEPYNRQLAPSSPDKARALSNLNPDLIDYFVKNRHSPLLGRVFNEWLYVAAHNELLTDSEHAKALAKLSESLLVSINSLLSPGIYRKFLVV